ncbi:hypothetical protein F4556_005078 [Kitasatospora gansuensis]|uniref:Uncharacterized protein n=1 Tax=Kitasatospora gansuensis TaxID=258050 RepID=A0A7W7WJU9_9ACTN|nr:hypothetical protein [Kitasatospora gansuensis]MBB4949543.1 hypothetical protein [Kitasatospora gansuensis]
MGFEFNIEKTDGTDDRTCWHFFSTGQTAVIRTVMRDFGMLTDPPVPDHVLLSTFDLTAGDFTGPDQVVPGKEANLAAIQAAFSARMSATEAEIRGIPHYKVNGNDGWLIAPAEVTAALAAYDAAPAGQRADIEATYRDWVPWLAFLRRSVEHTGIRVY